MENFDPFDKVLVRDADDGKWVAAFYSHYMYEEIDYPYHLLRLVLMFMDSASPTTITPSICLGLQIRQARSILTGKDYGYE